MNWMAELVCRLRGHRWARSYDWDGARWSLCDRCDRWLSFATPPAEQRVGST